jgi:serine phosphatase RsbU (regulator of sigma subunit)/pSer/pThr/pTyr-binding forkhead associated (FHA) protein
MAVPTTKTVPQELLIHTPDGKTRSLELNRDSISLGRSSANDLCYPDDAGLSRQHLVIERVGDGWAVRDLGSKNGTLVNGNRIGGPHSLAPNDRIAAGHLSIDFGHKKPAAAGMDRTVVFIDSGGPVSTSTTVASLASVLGEQKELKDRVHIRALLEAGKQLAEYTSSLDKLFEDIMGLSIEAVGAARGVLMTVENGELLVRAARGAGFRISTHVRDRVLNEGVSMLVRDARLDQALAERMSIVEQQVRSILAVPLQTEKGVMGLIYLDSPHFVHEFSKDDMSLLTMMASIAAVRIEHARLAEVEQTERLLAKELEQAAEIQRGLLPKQAPVIPGVDLAGYNSPCRTVGGDYFDFLPYDDGRVAILVADVAGKGMPAAMLMSNLQARVQVLFDDPTDLAALVTRLNRIIVKNCPSNRFISLFIGVYDTKTGDIVYCNAGHNPPLVVRCAGGRVEELESTGVILGILPNAKFEQRTAHLEIGDVVVLFSDGVTEACGPDSDDQYGEERLGKVFTDTACTSAQQVCERVQHELTEWMGTAPPADDITLVIARRTA